MKSEAAAKSHIGVMRVPLEVGQLTKCEITHERDEEGNYTLALSVEDNKVALDFKDVGQLFRNMTKIYIHCADSRKLVILDKP